MRSAPAIYGWRTRRRLYRWYGELKYLEIQLRHLPADAPRDELLHQLDQIEDRVTHAALPLAFAEHAYVLKEHTELVRRRMQAPAASATAAAPPATLS